MDRQLSEAGSPRGGSAAADCTNQALQGPNPFAALTDRERRNIRAICTEAGCLECEQLLVIRGRNCNSYGCKVHGCDELTRTIALFRLISETVTRG